MPDDSVTPETLLSHVDGQAGSLIVCGHSLAELVADFGFVGCATMLWRMAATGPAAVRARYRSAPLPLRRMHQARAPKPFSCRAVFHSCALISGS
jgi:hypothetical protein